jgi:hypothetical protein
MTILHQTGAQNLVGQKIFSMMCRSEKDVCGVFGPNGFISAPDVSMARPVRPNRGASKCGSTQDRTE